LAVLLNRAALAGTAAKCVFLPSIISLVAAGLGLLFQTEGPVNALAEFYHFTDSWLGSTTWAMPVLILLSIWNSWVSIWWCFWLDCKPFLTSRGS